MTEEWPADVYKRLSGSPSDTIRPPRCLLLMPFDKAFDDIAALIHDTANAVFAQFRDFFELPQVDRLDWVTSSGAIQQQIWQRIVEADLVICDLTGYNPNVMFESGVVAAWKTATQVISLVSLPEYFPKRMRGPTKLSRHSCVHRIRYVCTVYRIAIRVRPLRAVRLVQTQAADHNGSPGSARQHLWANRAASDSSFARVSALPVAT